MICQVSFKKEALRSLRGAFVIERKMGFPSAGECIQFLSLTYYKHNCTWMEDVKKWKHWQERKRNSEIVNA